MKKKTFVALILAMALMLSAAAPAMAVIYYDGYYCEGCLNHVRVAVACTGIDADVYSNVKVCQAFTGCTYKDHYYWASRTCESCGAYKQMYSKHSEIREHTVCTDIYDCSVS